MATTASYIPGVTLSDKLRLAASKGQIDKVRDLVVAGADFEPDREGRTALHYGALNGYADVVKFLADQGCDINAQDNLGYTALHRAAAQGHLEVVKVLLNERCDLDRQDDVHGNAALHEASWNGYSRTLELLVKQQAHVHILNKAGFSGLHLAAQNGHNQSARVLLYAGCNPDHKNNYGDTSLHTAARYGHAGVARILISAKCNINEQNKNGDTALHIAAALKRRKIAKICTEGWTNTTIKNKQNETAADVARRKDHPEIILIINSQPKNKKKKNKKSSKAEKVSTEMSEDSEKKERKGFFFKKKSKEAPKDVKLTRDKSKDVGGAATASVSVSAVPSQAPSSEGSTFNSLMPPGQILQGFRQHQQIRQKQQQLRGKSQSRGASTSTRDGQPGALTKFVPKPGMQLYRDLAGNVKQGPVAHGPVCSCQPRLKKLEKKVEADHANLYDHINASHRNLTDRLENLDHRTSQQVFAIDKLTKERLDAERIDREEYVNQRALKERLEWERHLESQQDCARAEMQAWIESRMPRYARDDCFWGHSRVNVANSQHNLLNQGFNNGYHTRPDQQQYGALFRSRSDETLSVSSSHPSRRFSKSHTRAMHEIRKQNMMSAGRRRNHDVERRNHDAERRNHDIERRNHDMERVRGLTVRDAPAGRIASGRSPDGNSCNEYNDSPDRWNEPLAQPVSLASPTLNNRLPNKLLTSQGHSMHGAHPGPSGEQLSSGTNAHPFSRSEPHLVEKPLGALPTSKSDYQTSGKLVINKDDKHSKTTDSGSNPDSGYGSKAYGGKLSLPQESPRDTHNSSIITNGSSIEASSHGTAEMDRWYQQQRQQRQPEPMPDRRGVNQPTAMVPRPQGASSQQQADNRTNSEHRAEHYRNIPNHIHKPLPPVPVPNAYQPHAKPVNKNTFNTRVDVHNPYDPRPKPATVQNQISRHPPANSQNGPHGDMRPRVEGQGHPPPVSVKPTGGQHPKQNSVVTKQAYFDYPIGTQV